MSLIPTREDMAFGEGHSQASETYGRMIDHLVKERDAALAEITQLRAERDASDLALRAGMELAAEDAARDMRERCAKVAETHGRDWDPIGNVIASDIRALPDGVFVIATESKTGDGE